eukprot:Filipodium_phascolosomae@DN4579_c0_g1_i1.p1
MEHARATRGDVVQFLFSRGMSLHRNLRFCVTNYQKCHSLVRFSNPVVASNATRLLNNTQFLDQPLLVAPANQDIEYDAWELAAKGLPDEKLEKTGIELDHRTLYGRHAKVPKSAIVEHLAKSGFTMGTHITRVESVLDAKMSWVTFTDKATASRALKEVHGTFLNRQPLQFTYAHVGLHTELAAQRDKAIKTKQMQWARGDKPAPPREGKKMYKRTTKTQMYT